MVKKCQIKFASGSKINNLHRMYKLPSKKFQSVKTEAVFAAGLSYHVVDIFSFRVIQFNVLWPYSRVLDVNNRFKIKNLNFKVVFKNISKLVRKEREWQWPKGRRSQRRLLNIKNSQ